MPILIECPNCHKQLRVQDTMVGKRVKCPSCATVVTATAPGGPPPAAPPPPPPPAAPPPPPREEVVDYQGGEDEPYDGEDREERRRRKKKKARRGAERLKLPAIFMLILGIIGVLLVLVSGIMTLVVGAGAAMAAEGIERQQNEQPGGFGPGFPRNPAAPNFGPRNRPEMTPEDRAEAAGVLRKVAAFGIGGTIVSVLVGMLFNGLIIFGSAMMLKRRSYGMAITATILTLLTGLGTLVGGVIMTFLVICMCFVPILGAGYLGIGIWALVVLMSADVKAAFA
jgi:predicted Zn finger-like uncharacterized protein